MSPATASTVNYRGVAAEAAPPDFGKPDAETEALATGCGVFDRSFCDRLVLSGEDRARFLNGQVTCAVKDLAPGTGTFGFVTSIKGRVETEFALLSTDDQLWLDLPPGRAEPIRERLAKYVIVDRVEFSTPEFAVLTLLGPKFLEVASAVCPEDPDELLPNRLPEGAWHHRESTIAGRAVRLVREPVRSANAAGCEGLSIWLDPNDVDDVLAALRDAGAVQVGWRAFESLRMERGRPLWGVDFGGEFAGDAFPQETGLDEAVSYTKGCYLGQEVVARIHYRGGVQRHMRRLALSGPVEVGTDSAPDLVWQDKSVGRLTSAAPSLGGEWLGLAVVHQRAEPGVQLDVRSDQEADQQTVATATILESAPR